MRGKIGDFSGTILSVTVHLQRKPLLRSNQDVHRESGQQDFCYKFTINSLHELGICLTIPEPGYSPDKHV